MKNCGHHAGECPQESNSEGTFCTISGVELTGPVEIEYDFSRSGNRIRSITSSRTRHLRKTHSLKKKERSVVSPQVWMLALQRLCPNMSIETTKSLSRALLNWSTSLDLCRKTHPAMKNWPLLFTATVTSHMAEDDASSCLFVPHVPQLRQYCPKHAEYKRYGISCRSMSVTWRSIRSKVLGPDGDAVLPLEWKLPLETI